MRQEVLALLSKMGPPLPLETSQARCRDCGAEGDPRLLPSHCHMEARWVHRGATETHHPGLQEDFHSPGTAHLHCSENGEEGRLRRRWFTRLVPFGKLGKKRYTCCNRREGKPSCREVRLCCRKAVSLVSPGCKARHQCCGTEVSTTATGCRARWACCGLEVQGQGCRSGISTNITGILLMKRGMTIHVFSAQARVCEVPR